MAAPEVSPGSRNSRLPQIFAVLLCLLLGLLMIVNNQLGGEAMWFWYATVFHHGVHLYSTLHLPLQPLYLLMTDAWMILFGRNLIVTEIPSLLEIGALCLGVALVARESPWPRPARAIMLLGGFCLTVSGHSYRFDDYHVVSENFILYSLLALLVLARTASITRQRLLILALGILSGLTITTRLNDGLALTVAAALCIPFLIRKSRALYVAGFLFAALLTVVFVVHLTGDSLAVYLSSSLFKAANSKGGTGSIFAAPFLMFRNTIPLMLKTGKRVLADLIAIVALAPLLLRYRRQYFRHIISLQLALALFIFLVQPTIKKHELLKGLFISIIVLLVTALLYILLPVVLARLALARSRGTQVDPREILLLLPLAEWASSAAASAGQPLTDYYAPVALALLLVPILQPFRRFARWADPSFLTVMLLLILSTFTSKIIIPYSWQNYRVGPMFQNRAWYHHPVYGEMYIDRDLLHLSTRICSDIGSHPGANQPDLLSLPYPFPNYFCDTPPWHNYVQTFFDISTRATIEQLMAELNTAPPEWIVYQRQLNILTGAERFYNHNQPLAQRDLDHMIAQKLSSGQWKLVDQSDYLGMPGGGWFIIHTRP